MKLPLGVTLDTGTGPPTDVNLHCYLHFECGDTALILAGQKRLEDMMSALDDSITQLAADTAASTKAIMDAIQKINSGEPTQAQLQHLASISAATQANTANLTTATSGGTPPAP